VIGNRLVCLFAVLIVLQSCLVAHADQARLVLADFEDAPRIWLVGEGVSPKSQASVTDEQAHGGQRSGKLAYTFDSLPGKLNYAGVAVKAQFMGTPTEFRVWVYGDGSGQPMRLRITDATGETFQYHMPDITWEGWREATASLAKPLVHWGGDNDGEWDLPLRLDSVLVDSGKEPFESLVYFDDLTYVADVRPVDQVDVRTESEAFGGVYWADEDTAPPDVVIRNMTADTTVEGSVRVHAVGDRGRWQSIMDESFSVPAGGEWRQALKRPDGAEGMCTAEGELTIGGMTREFSGSFVRFARPHDPALDPDSFFGACTHFGQGKGDIPRTFDLMSKAGIKWLRDEISWGACERTKGEIQIPEHHDRYMRAAVEHGVTPYIIFDYGNALYDEGNAPASPEAQEAFGEYCYALVDHFKDVCKHWEIYNEPNISFWRPKPDADAYARLMKVAYEAAKRADPDCTVVGVCTAGTDLAYIEKVLKQGGMAYMDALSIHPYRYPRSPEKSGFVREITRAHELMARYGGADKKIWLTEIGWPTQDDPRGVSEEVSGNYLIRMMVQAYAQPFVERVIWYDFQNDGFQRDYNEHNFGLIKWQTFQPKQNYVACKMLTEHLTDAKFVRRILPAGDDDQRYCYEFEVNGEPVLAAWCVSGPGTMALSMGAPQATLTWADAYRETRALPGGNLTLALSDMPVFITGGKGRAKLAKPIIQIEGPRRPLAPGERATVKIIAPPDSDYSLELSPDFPARTPRPLPRRENVFSIPVSRRAEPATGLLTARLIGPDETELASASITLEVADPLELRLGPPISERMGSLRLPVRFSGKRPVDMRGIRVAVQTPLEAHPLCDRTEVELTAANGYKDDLTTVVNIASAAPGKTVPVTVAATTGYGTEVSETFNVGCWGVPKVSRPPAIDGDSAEWANVPAAEVGTLPRDFWVLREGAWTGRADQSAKVRLSWDAAALYVLVEVTDDKHVQAQHGPEVWKSDNIQLAYDPGFASRKARLGDGQTPYAEIGLSRTDTGDEAYRWLWEEKPDPGITFASTREGTMTVYEAALPWSEMRAEAPSVGDMSGFALLINEDDGEGRDGWLEVYSGIGFGKDPARFGILRFADTPQP